MEAAQLDWRDEADGRAVLVVAGSCTMQHLPQLLSQIAALRRQPALLDLQAVQALDSAGALVLLNLPGRRWSASAFCASSAFCSRRSCGCLCIDEDT